jgi:hypothetical protein
MKERSNRPFAYGTLLLVLLSTNFGLKPAPVGSPSVTAAFVPRAKKGPPTGLRIQVNEPGAGFFRLFYDAIVILAKILSERWKSYNRKSEAREVRT